MSHKRVVEKRGKTYGPYLYESYRDEDGKVKKRYLGKVEETTKSYKAVIGFLVLALIVCLLIIGNWSLTGRATLSVDGIGINDGILTGKVLFVLQQSEMIPADTQVIINHGSFEQTYSLSDLVLETPIEGDYFISGKEISGSGLGYSTDSEKFPIVNFVLGIYEEIADGGDGEDENYTLPVEPTEPLNETEPRTRTITGNSIRTFITGMVVDESQYELVDEINASVRYNESFIYELGEGETADILSSEQSVDLVIENGQAIVTTDYLGEDTKTLEIDVDELNISAEDGDLVVSFVYNGTEIDSATRKITLDEPVENETNETLVGNETNETILEILDFEIQVDDLSYVILNSSSNKNQTSENLRVYTNKDSDSSIKLIRNWYRNGTSITLLNLPFEGGSNSTWTRDYSPYAKNGSVTMNVTGSWNNSSGQDEYGAYSFNSAANLIYHYWNNTTTSGAPAARREHTAVWNGTHMIIWGGANIDGNYINTGSRYSPLNNSWNATTITGAPVARTTHRAVWAGERMIVFGGWNGTFMNTGGVYNPITNTWTATNLTNAPFGRYNFVAVSTGDKMIVWGGQNDSFEVTNTGGIYDVATNTWTDTNLTNAPSPRKDAAFVWTGTEMIVWGGQDTSSVKTNTGGVYNPTTNTWRSMAGTPPAARTGHSMVWTGTEAIVWGGNSNVLENTGKRYNPVTNTWGAATSTTNAPTAIANHFATYINGEMIIFGGFGSGYSNEGGHYNVATNTWTATNNTSAPIPRVEFGLVTLKDSILVWGGATDPTVTNTGGRYYINAQDGASVSVNNFSLNPQGTISAWIKPLNASSSNAQGIVTNYYTSTSQGLGVELRANDISFLVKNSTAGGCNITTTSDVIQNNNWYHVVGMWNSSTCALYVNAQPNGTATASSNFDIIGEDLRIGAYNFFETNFFNGTIDDVLIFNETLSEEQISELYANGTRTIVSNETEIGETWKACVTANDLISDSNETCSNNLIIFNSSALCGTNISSDTILVGNLSCQGTALTIITNNTILDCNGSYIFGNSSGIGVDTYGNQNITIKNCWIENFNKGIGSSKTAGLVGVYLYKERIINNTLFNNTYGLSQITQCNITGNNISGGQRGIDISSSPAGSSNLITKNRITNNSAYGLYMFDPSNNNIYDNYFDNPTINLYTSSSGSNNNFNATYNCSIPGYLNILGETCQGGNYWSNYTGADNGSGSYPYNISGDGIGDTNIPYNSSMNGFGDYLPLVPGGMGPAGTIIVNLTSPENYYYINNTNINTTFNCSASDTNLSNITIQIWNSTNDLVFNSTRNVTGSYNYSTFVYNGTYNGVFEWNCEAYSLSSKDSAASNRTFVVSNGSGPVIELLNPENNSIKAVNNITFIYRATSTATSSDLNCSLILDGSIVSNWSVSPGRNWTYYNVSDGEHNWSIFCLDNESNPGMSDTYNLSVNSSISDSSAPEVQLRYPQDARKWYYSPVNVSLMYNASDDYGDLNCTLYTNFSGSWQAYIDHTNFAVAESEVINILFENLGLGGYLWNVECTDSSGNSAFASSNRTFYIVERTACYCVNCTDCTEKFIDNQCANVTLMNSITFSPATNQACINKTNVLDEIQREFIGDGYSITSNNNNVGYGIYIGSGQPLDIVLSIDSSGSMSGSKMSDAKTAANNLVDEIDLSKYKMGIIDFDSGARVAANLTTNSVTLHNAINALNAAGQTAIGDGINKALDLLANNNQSKAIILMSDGQHNYGSDPYAAALRAIEMNATIFTIGFGGDADEKMLKEIAELTSGEYYFAPSGDALKQIYLDILNDHIIIDDHVIRDINLTRWKHGIFLEGVINSTITNVSISNGSSNTYAGIKISEGKEIAIENSVSSIWASGINENLTIQGMNNSKINYKELKLESIANSTIFNNTAFFISTGSGAKNNNFSYNDATGATYGGSLFLIYGNNNTIMYNNISKNNVQYGTGLSVSGEGNTIKHNIANYNTEEGVVFGASNSVVENNTANYNGQYGFYIGYQAVGFPYLPSTFRNNTAMGNTYYSYFVDDLSCDSDLDSSNVGGDTGKPLLYFNHNNENQLIQNTDAYSEIFVCNSTNITLNNVTVTNPVYGSDGILLIAAANATIINSNVSKVNIGVYMNSRGSLGLDVENPNVSNNIFEFNHGGSNTAAGIYSPGSILNGGTFYNNTFKNNTATYGILVSGDNLTIINNLIQDSGSSRGITIGSGNNLFVANNNISGHITNFYGTSFNNLTFYNNTLSRGGSNSVDIQCTRCNISYNNVFLSLANAIDLGATTHSVISNNNLSFAGTNLIAFTSGSWNLTIENNSLSNAKRGGIYTANNYNNSRIINNTITNTSYLTTLSNYGGIYARGVNLSVLGNRLENITGYGINLYILNNSVVANNTVVNATHAGIFMYGVVTVNQQTRYNNVTGNNISNSSIGIYLQQYASNSTISRNIVENSSNRSIYIGSLYNNNSLIYDNFFNSTANVDDYSTGNNWNTTYNCSIENYTNIIGENCSGGNLWSDYNGTDMNGDGIGDTYLPWKGTTSIVNGGDYLPLGGSNFINVTLISPEDYNATSASSVDFNCSAITTGTLSNITLQVWNSTGDLVYFNESNVSGNSNYSEFSASNLAYGILEWNCLAYDDSGIGFADNNNTLVHYNNTLAPYIVLLNPENASIKVKNNITFLYEAYATIVSDLNCTLLIDRVNVSTSNNIDGRNWVYENVSEGNHIWQVLCIDNESNVGISLEYEFEVNTSITDSSNPLVDLQIPANNKIYYSLDKLNITFIYNASDDYGDLNCTFYSNISGSWQASANHSSYPVANEEWIAFTYENISTNNTYIWNVLCSDSTGNSAFNSANFTISLVEPGPCECSNCADCELRLDDLSCLSVTVTADFNYSGSGTCIDKSKTIGQTAVVFDGAGKLVSGVDGDGSGIVFGGGGTVDIFMVIDTSGSMLDDGKLVAAKDAAITFVDEVSGNYSIGLVEFDSDASVVTNLTTNHSAVVSGIFSLEYDGGRTAIGEGIIKAVSNYNLSDTNRSRIMILLSDGRNNEPSNKSAWPIPAANYAAENNVTIYSIAYGGDADRKLMEQIAMITGGEYFFSPTNETIQQTYLDILDTFINLINVEVKNFTVSNFANCLVWSKTYDSELSNSSFYNCTNFSVYSTDGERNLFADLGMHDSGNTGLGIVDAPNNNLTRIYANNSSTGDGIYVYYSENSRLSDIEVYDSGDEGLYIAYSNDTILDNISSSNNTDRGIYSYRSERCNLTDLTANYNDEGIVLEYAHNNSVESIVTNNNDFTSASYGLYLLSSNRTNVTNVTANENRYGVNVALSNNIKLDTVIANNNSHTGLYSQLPRGNISISNVIANNNTQNGVLLSQEDYISWSNVYRNITNITTNYNLGYGLYGVFLMHYTFRDIVSYNNSGIGVRLSGNTVISNTDNVSVENVNASLNGNHGFHATLNYSNFTSIIANNNTNNGVLISESGISGNRLNNTTANYNKIGIEISAAGANVFNNTAINNSDYSYYIGTSINPFFCRNTVSNTTNLGGSFGKPFLYVNNSVSKTIQNTDAYSEIEFCDVNNSVINNVTIFNPGTNSDGILLRHTRNINITNSNMSNVYSGIFGLSYYSTFSYSNISNNSINNADAYGIYLTQNNVNQKIELYYNNFTNIEGNGTYGSFAGNYITSANNSNYMGNRFVNTNTAAFYLSGISIYPLYLNHTLIDNYFENATTGFNLISNSTLINNTFIDNDYGIYSEASILNSTIRNNTFTNNEVGVQLGYDPCDGFDQFGCLNHEQCAWDFGNSICEYTGSYGCSNSADDDGDSYTDCADDDCSYIYPCFNNTRNFVYWNEFYNNTLHADAFYDGEQFNTTVNGEAQGNFWDDVINLDIYDTNHNIWADSGSDLPYWYYTGGNVNNSVYDYAPIVQALSVYANAIECEINTNGNWSNCSNVTYDMNLTRVRINCTDNVAILTNATFVLRNIPDNYTFFNVSNASEISGDWWIYDNADIFVRDGGEWNLSAVCINNNSQREANSTNWSLAWGTLSGVLITNSSNVTQNEFFDFSAQVTCVGGECGNVTSIADPEQANIFSENTREIQGTCSYDYCYLTYYDYWDWAYYCADSGFCDYSEETCNSECSGGGDCTCDLNAPPYCFINDECSSLSQSDCSNVCYGGLYGCAWNWDESVCGCDAFSPPLCYSITQNFCSGYTDPDGYCVDNACVENEGCTTGGGEECQNLWIKSVSEEGGYFAYFGTCTITEGSDWVKFTTGEYANECYAISYYDGTFLQVSVYPSVKDYFDVYDSENSCCTEGAGGECPAGATLVGNESDVIANGISNLSVKINGTWNDSPSGINNVSLYDGETLLIEFEWDFNSSNALNMSAINITKTANGIYIEGANVSKTIYIPVGAAFGVCIKNNYGYIANAELCNGTSEIFLSDENCNGSSITLNGDSVTCNIAEGNYVISGLTHSGGEAQDKGVIPMNSGTPFYTTSQNPDNTTCVAMYKGDVCNVTWSVNATGNATGNSTWKFYTIFNATQYAEVVDNTTNIINITITEANAVPIIQQLFVNSTYGDNLTNESLFCWANASDDDLDNLSYSGYWYLNGGQNISFSTGNFIQGELVLISELLSGNTTAGENWSCNASAYDGIDYSDSLMSENLTVIATLINTNLSIWDSTDVEAGSQKKLELDDVKFYANYTNLTGENISGATCLISFNDSIDNSMTFNASLGVYVYNRTFDGVNISGSNFTWNVSCEKVSYYPAFEDDVVFISPLFINYSDCFKADKNYGYNDSNPNPEYVLVGVESHGDEVDWVKVCRLRKNLSFDLNNCYRRDRNYGHSDGPANENYLGIGFETHGDEVDWFHVCNLPTIIANLSNCCSADKNYGCSDDGYTLNFAVIGAETHGDEVDWVRTCEMIYLAGITPTSVNLISPEDNYHNPETNLSEINVTLNCSATSGYNLSNITTYVWNWTGDLVYTNTTNVSGNENSSAVLFSPSSLGAYSWNCLASSTNDSAWATSNNTIAFGPGPNIEFTEPTPVSGEEVGILFINVSATGENLDSIIIYLYDSEGEILDSFESNATPFYLEFDNLSNGEVYYFNATAYNTDGMWNSTETRNITFNRPYWGCQVINTSDIVLKFYSDVVSNLSDYVDSNTCRWNYTNGTPGNYGCIAYPPNVSDPNVSITYFKSCYTINASNVTIDCRGHNITGDGNIDHGIDLSPFVGTSSAFQDFSLKNCTVKNFGYGILTSHSNNTTLFNNTFSYNDDDSIYAYNASNFKILNNSLLNSGWVFSGDGMQIYHSNNLDILYNYIYNDSWNSMYILNLSNSNISYNHINVSSANGLFINKGVSLNILNNTIEGVDYDGMYLTSVNDSNISENILRNIGDNGIIINKCNNSEFSNNTILDIASYGAQVLDSSFARLINNTIINTSYGVGLYGFDYSVFSDNLIDESEYAGIDTYDIYDSVIANNSIYNSGSDGIWVYEVYNSSVINNTVLNSTDSGIIVEYSEDNNLTFNYLENNALGFKVLDSVNNLFKSNILQGNADAITLTSSNNTIYNNLFNNSASVSDSGNNIWNTSYTSEEGLNILGEPYLGGNFWGDYNGTDDGSGSAYPWNIAGDGIGDTELPWKGISSIDNGGDWLPLVQGGEIQNAVPVIQQIFVNSSLGTNYSDEDLTCWVNATDSEGDNLSYSGFWYKNGEQNLSFSTGNFTQGSLINVSILLSGNTTAGENWSCNVSAYDGENYSSYVMSENLTILAFTDNCSVYFNETSPLTYPASFIVYTNCTSAYTLYRNGTSIVNGSEQILGAGTYNFTVIRDDNLNYVNYYDEENFVIQPATGIVYAYLNASRSNITTDNGTYINLSAVLNTGSGSIKLYINDTLINQGTGTIYNNTLFDTLGLYNISAVYDGNENYSSDIETWYVDVTISAIVCGNGIVETGEHCDLTNLSGESCVTRGYAGGSLSCTASCTFNTSACTSGGGGGGCTDQCSSGEEESECVSEISSRTRYCGNYDSDSCLEWSDWNETMCFGGEICNEGVCMDCDFNCSDWGACINGIESRVCDSEECEISGRIETRECSSCQEDWSCEWSICAEGEVYSYAYDCVDANNCGTLYNMPRQIPCNEVMSDFERYGCNVRWNCSDWGLCEIDLRFSHLFKNESVQEGTQRRYCIDDLECTDSIYEKRPCEARVDIFTSKVQWCEEDYVEVYEKSTNKLVSRVKEGEKIGSIDLGRININFLTTEFGGYCDYCYDGIKNYDETDVDCGGPSCPECIAESDFFDWLFWLILFLWASIIIFTATILWEERQFIWMLLREEERKKAEAGLLRGVERMAYYQTPNLYPQIIDKSKGSRFKLFDLIKRFGRNQSYGLKAEKGINVSRHGIEKKYNVRDIPSYKEGKQLKKEWGIARKIREFFERKPAKTFSRTERFRQLSKPGNANAGKNISSTRTSLRGKGF